jgi:hypothetical protein
MHQISPCVAPCTETRRPKASPGLGAVASPGRGARGRAWFALTCAALVLGGCNSTPTPKPQVVTPTVRDVPGALRGTLGAQARLRGVTPTRASGIGFVVGLNGTGGLPMPENVAATLEREMGLLGIGKSGAYEGTPLEGKTAAELLADPNTAAVIVEAALPPGARKGTPFDVYVRAINATSLEGGTLWTTELRAGPPSAFGSRQAVLLAEARGPIFINPFAGTENTAAAVSRTTGRILNGGRMAEDLQIEVVLDNPSHGRARLITSVINSAFPAREGDRGPTARGRDDALVAVQVPARYNDRREEFAELLRNLTVDPTFWEAYAKRYATALVEEPYLADDVSWALEAMGERSLPFVRELYESNESGPRLRALRAGANLADPMAAEPLMEIAARGAEGLRSPAIRLLERVESGPKLDLGLRELVGEPSLTVRTAAYETLVARGVREQRRRLEAAAAERAGRAEAPEPVRQRLAMLSRLRLPPGTLQGVTRRVVNDSFLLDRVPGGEPLIYITQQGEPRIALFGERCEVQRPLLVSIDSGSIMFAADGPDAPVRVLRNDPRTGQQLVIREVPTDLGELVEVLSRRPSAEDPRAGLGLTYGEVVDVLYELWRQGGTRAAFATERDRLLAELLRAGESEEIVLRPEAPGEEGGVLVLDPLRATPAGMGAPTGGLLVPVAPPPGAEPVSTSGGSPSGPAAGDGGGAADGVGSSRPE